MGIGRAAEQGWPQPSSPRRKRQEVAVIVVALLVLFMFAPPSVSLLVSAIGAVLLFRAARIRLAKWRGDPVPVARAAQDDRRAILNRYALEHLRQVHEEQFADEMRRQTEEHLRQMEQHVQQMEQAARYWAAQDWD
jgi:hypothetical protein